MKLIFFFLITIASIDAASQKQNNQWRFGKGGGIDFNTTPPSNILGALINTGEGCASVADKNTGALLFYTDGITVWNAKNQIMPNGTGLLGGTQALLSSTTAAVIIPKPGSNNQYFIVTIDEQSSNNGINYNLVDMSLNAGLGDIVIGQKNLPLFKTTSEKLEVVPASDNNSYWLITHDNPGNSFYCFKVTSSGIQKNPIISTIGATQGNGAGHMKINRQFNRLALGELYSSSIELYDFDNATGVLSNPISFKYNLTNPLIYGIEFSPDGKILYISNLDKLVQFNISQPNSLAIQNSIYLIPTSFSVPATLQLAVDGKIYVNSGNIAVINCPNELGLECGYQQNAIANQIGGGGYGLPKWIYFTNDPPSPNSNDIIYSDTCFGNPIQFVTQETKSILSIDWNFGDTETGINNSAIGFSAKHTFSKVGNFKVRAILTNSCGTDTIYKSIIITNCKDNVGDCRIFFPNAFSPNGDGINEKFYPFTICSLENYECIIFNKWGQIIFKTSSQLEKWDGKHKGIDCPVGVYVYLIKYKFSSQVTKKVHGLVTLLR